ncbi:4'-phosphopantetheinyl transferase family protein [Pseudomonas sp. TE24901]
MHVFMWPQTRPRWQDGVLLIGLRHMPGMTREAARARVRQALSEALLQALDVPQNRIRFHSSPGQAPQIRVPGHEDAGLSISHDGDFSVAAVHLHGPVGIDVMAVQDTPDWQSVTSDYLGPHVLARLCAASQAQRARLFTRAWCEREARLKCVGQGLGEWSPRAARGCRTVEVGLPAGLVGALALRA